jgi:heptosyltransferase II
MQRVESTELGHPVIRRPRDLLRMRRPRGMFAMKSVDRLVVRAPNWVGDAVMSLPAIEELRQRWPSAHLAVLARPQVAALYRSPLVDEVLLDRSAADWKDIAGRWRVAARLRRRRFGAAVLLPNSFEVALVARLAGIPIRIGYAARRRGWLLTHPVPPPDPRAPLRHQSLRYLDLLQAAGLIVEVPLAPTIRIPGAAVLREAGRGRLEGAWIGVAPGSANGTAKRWPAERFAEATALAARDLGARVALFGSADERELCARVAGLVEGRGIGARSFAGHTDLQGFLELAAACRGMLANDSGSLHVADALGVPTIAVFGPTSPVATGPTGPRSRIVRVEVDCAPCLLHHCPLDLRCMTGVPAGPVAAALVTLVQQSSGRPRAD